MTERTVLPVISTERKRAEKSQSLMRFIRGISRLHCVPLEMTRKKGRTVLHVSTEIFLLKSNKKKSRKIKKKFAY